MIFCPDWINIDYTFSPNSHSVRKFHLFTPLIRWCLISSAFNDRANSHLWAAKFKSMASSNTRSVAPVWTQAVTTRCSYSQQQLQLITVNILQSKFRFRPEITVLLFRSFIFRNKNNFKSHLVFNLVFIWIRIKFSMVQIKYILRHSRGVLTPKKVILQSMLEEYILRANYVM